MGEGGMTNPEMLDTKEQIPSLGRIKYSHPNPDIYVWPPGSNLPPRAHQTEQPPYSPRPPPLTPPIMRHLQHTIPEDVVAAKSRDKSSVPAPSDTTGTPTSEQNLKKRGAGTISDEGRDLIHRLQAFYREYEESSMVEHENIASGRANMAETGSFKETPHLRSSPVVPSLAFAPPVSSRLREATTPSEEAQSSMPPPSRRNLAASTSESTPELHKSTTSQSRHDVDSRPHIEMIATSMAPNFAAHPAMGHTGVAGYPMGTPGIPPGPHSQLLHQLGQRNAAEQCKCQGSKVWRDLEELTWAST
ncbi:hypothetical protein V8C42DRAFT_254318 [Trichoderma barbatum]